MILSVQPSRAAGDERFDRQDIPFNSKVLGVFFPDLDGDAISELLLFLENDDQTRRLRILKQGQSRSFATATDIDLALPSTVFALQIIDFDNDRKEEILLLGHDTLYLLELDNGVYSGNMEVVASFEPLFSLPDPEHVTALDFAFDLNDDGVFELLLPNRCGVQLLVQHDGKYVRSHQFKIRQKAAGVRRRGLLQAGQQGAFSLALPRVAAHDLNTDRIQDVFIETANGLAVFHQTGDLNFRSVPDKRVGVRSSYREDLCFFTSALSDLNNDGLIDYCRVFTQAEGFDVKSLVEVFLGNIHSGYPQRPSRRIVLEEFIVGLTLVDLGGGTTSLVVATEKLSTVSMVKSLMVKRIPVELKVFAFSGGMMAEEPLAVKKTSCALRLLGQQFPARFIGSMRADLDGDGKNELVVIDHDDKLQVYKGGGKEIFADKPLYSLSLPGTGTIITAHLDSDRKADLVLVGVDEDGRERITILRPK